MKIIETFSQFTTERQDFLYTGEDILTKEEVLFHGTSFTQWKKIINGGFIVTNFYVGDSYENIARNYAELQSSEDNSDGVIIVLNSEFLEGVMKDDYHGDVRQVGQYIFNGNIKSAIHTVKNVDTNEIIMTYKDI